MATASKIDDDTFRVTCELTTFDCLFSLGSNSFVSLRLRVSRFTSTALGAAHRTSHVSTDRIPTSPGTVYPDIWCPEMSPGSSYDVLFSPAIARGLTWD
jgi:hypothetical protein